MQRKAASLLRTKQLVEELEAQASTWQLLLQLYCSGGAPAGERDPRCRPAAKRAAAGAVTPRTARRRSPPRPSIPSWGVAALQERGAHAQTTSKAGAPTGRSCGTPLRMTRCSHGKALTGPHVAQAAAAGAPLLPGCSGNRSHRSLGARRRPDTARWHPAE